MDSEATLPPQFLHPNPTRPESMTRTLVRPMRDAGPMAAASRGIGVARACAGLALVRIVPFFAGAPPGGPEVKVLAT